MTDLERLRELSLAEQIARMHRLWRTAADLELAPLGLTHPRWTALWKLSRMPKANAPLPNDDYPDLSKLEIFR